MSHSTHFKIVRSLRHRILRTTENYRLKDLVHKFLRHWKKAYEETSAPKDVERLLHWKQDVRGHRNKIKRRRATKRPYASVYRGRYNFGEFPHKFGNEGDCYTCRQVSDEHCGRVEQSTTESTALDNINTLPNFIPSSAVDLRPIIETTSEQERSEEKPVAFGYNRFGRTPFGFGGRNMFGCGDNRRNNAFGGGGGGFTFRGAGFGCGCNM